MLQLIVEYQAVIALGLLLVMFAMFMAELYPPEVTATGMAGVFIALGFVSTQTALDVFSNPAPITIAAMFILSGALVRTGVLEALANAVVDRASANPIAAVGVFVVITLVASAFVNNTPIVLVLIPVVIKLAHAMDIAPTRLLIPLSYVGVLGGACTLIGTSTNLLVDGVARETGMEPFSIFEITPVGIIAALCGLAMLALLGRFLLPDRGDATEDLLLGETEYLSEAKLINDNYDGRELGSINALNRPGIKIAGIKRRGDVLRRNLDEQHMEKSDRLIIRAQTSELLTLAANENLDIGIKGASQHQDDSIVVEAVVAPRQTQAGRSLSELSLSRRFGIRVLGVHRHRHIPAPELGKVRIKPADKFLLKGTPGALEELTRETDLVSVSQPAGRAYRRGRAPIAIAVLTAVIALAAINVMPIAVLGLIGVGAILLLRCIDSEEAWGSLDGSILALIFSMLIIGQGLQSTGAVTLIVTALTPFLETLPPFLALLTIYYLASLLTELVTNNAVAVVVTPVVIALAEPLGIDARALVVAVMFGASASFATPIGYQTNTLVYGAADYRFSDFLRIGVPMNISVGLAATAAIWFFFV